MPQVYSKRGAHPEDAVYVGRPSVFGNPFTIGRDGSRHEVVVKFRNHLVANPALLAQAKEQLAGRNLLCWCAPEECHADVLLWFAND